MRDFDPAFIDHLLTGCTTTAFLFKVTRTDAMVFGFTDHDIPITFDTVTYEPDSGFSRSELQLALGLAVNTSDITGALSSDKITEADIALGLWDRSEIIITVVNWADLSQFGLISKGTLGEVTRGELAFQSEVRGLSNDLNQDAGRTYGRLCDAVLGDHRCTFDLTQAGFHGSGTIISGTDDIALVASGLGSFDAGWFSQGVLTWVTGANAGGKTEVRGHSLSGSDAALVLWQKAALPVEAGDTFTITAGCDKTFATCKAKFNNVLNNRSAPYMPDNDFALSFAKANGPNDGGSLFN
jgi:uncharacterized phage protein (TIGR02218 family)